MSNQQHQRWQRGDQIVWTYRNPDFPGLVDQRPVTVIADDDHHVAVWMAAGTRMLYQVSTDGQDLRSLSGADRFTAPRAQAVRSWVGSGILAVFQPNTMYSVWFFETKPGVRNSYYVNIEEEFTRSDSGIETSDLVLDVVVSPDRICAFKDEDELEFAHHAGVFSTAKVEQIRQVAQQAVEDVEHWKFPFNAGYEDFQLDPDWTVDRSLDLRSTRWRSRRWRRADRHSPPRTRRRSGDRADKLAAPSYLLLEPWPGKLARAPFLFVRGNDKGDRSSRRSGGTG